MFWVLTRRHLGIWHKRSFNWGCLLKLPWLWVVITYQPFRPCRPEWRKRMAVTQLVFESLIENSHKSCKTFKGTFNYYLPVMSKSCYAIYLCYSKKYLQNNLKWSMNVCQALTSEKQFLCPRRGSNPQLSDDRMRNRFSEVVLRPSTTLFQSESDGLFCYNQSVSMGIWRNLRWSMNVRQAIQSSES